MIPRFVEMDLDGLEWTWMDSNRLDGTWMDLNGLEWTWFAKEMKKWIYSEPKKSGLFGSIDCCIISDQILELFIKHTFSTLFWLQSEHRQKFVPSFVWIQRHFEVDMSILWAGKFEKKSCFQKITARFNPAYLLN